MTYVEDEKHSYDQTEIKQHAAYYNSLLQWNVYTLRLK